jgi:nucleoside-diphosphate-sugar epimerase
VKALFIGGTGTISLEISRQLIQNGCELYLLNRGTRNNELPEGAIELRCDINDESEVFELIKDMSFDVVADFIAFVPSQLERDYRLFYGKTKQFIFISSASVYKKPVSDYFITEGTTVSNPYWEYSRNKILCEEYLISMYRKTGFPVTIVRPSHTYDNRSIPLGVHGNNGSWQVAKRMLAGKPVIIHGDGSSLWTMTHNSDFAKAFIGLMDNIKAIGETFHITSDEVITWNQIYQCIADALGVTLNAVHISSEFLSICSKENFKGSLLGDKANSLVFDNSKIKRLVPDFIAVKRFSEGIKETIDFIMAHPELQKSDEEFDIWCDKVINAVVDAASAVKQS